MGGTEEAEREKEKGNVEYKMGNYRAAVEHYKAAVRLAPNCATYHNNSAACHLLLGQPKEAMAEARLATQLEPGLAKAWGRVGRAALMLGQEEEARRIVAKLYELGLGDDGKEMTTTLEAMEEMRRSAEEALLVGRCQDSLHFASKWLDQAPYCRAAKLVKAESLLLLEDWREAGEEVQSLLKEQPMDVDALHLRALLCYYQEQWKKAEEVWKAVLKLDPDHADARVGLRKGQRLVEEKERGNAAFRVGKYDQALAHYTQALTIDSTHKAIWAKLLYNRATAHSKLGDLSSCVDDCSAALELQPTYSKALHRRAVCHDELNEQENAVRDWSALCTLEPHNGEYKEGLRKAKRAKAELERKDYYALLQVEKTATLDEIKKAYRKEAVRHHPDKHADASEEEKAEHEKKFKDIAEAFSVLSDTKLRWNYDNADGEDEGWEVDEDGNIDSEAIWNQLFGGGLNSSYVVINDW